MTKSKVHSADGHVATVCFFRVGHGDSAILELSSGEIIVIDAAFNTHSDDSEPPVIQYLEERGRKDVHLLVLTHPDSDHWNGVPRLIKWVKEKGGRIHNVILYGGPTIAEFLLQLREQYEKGKKRVLRNEALDEAEWRHLDELCGNQLRVEKLLLLLRDVKRNVDKNDGLFRRNGPFGHVKSFGNDVHIFALGPTSEAAQKWQSATLKDIINLLLFRKKPSRRSMNALSCVIWVWIGDTAILLGGDATKDAWLKAIRQYEKNHKSFFERDIQANIIKASHHGAKTGSSKELWDKITVQEGSHIIFSAGPHKGWKHPCRATLGHLSKCKNRVSVYCTNICPARLEDIGLVLGCPHKREMMALERLGVVPKSTRVPTLIPAHEPCHGNCKFEIWDNSDIRPLPQVDRGPCWYLDKKAKNTCFSTRI